MLRLLLLSVALAVTWSLTAGAATPGASAPADLPTPQFRRLGMAEGLPSSSVTAVLQDRQGFIWFGGDGGIARYDGVEFRRYTHQQNNPDSLASNDVTQLLAGQDGSLWVGTGDYGVDRLLPDGERFVHYSKGQGLSGFVVYALAQTSDGSLWVGTDSGLDRIDKTGRIEHIDYQAALGHPPQGRELTIGALLARADGTLWIGTWSGALIRRSPDGRLQTVPVDWLRPQERPQIWRINEGDGELRIATRQGLYVMRQGRAEPMFTPAEVPPGYAFDSARDRAGRLWVATLNGVVMRDRQGHVHLFHAQELLPSGLPTEWTWRVLVDREGGLWFTFADGGVAYLAPGWDDFIRYTHVPDDASSLSDTHATALAESADQRLWVGGRHGIDRLDPASGAVEHVLTGLPNAVSELLDDGHALWFIRHGLLFRYAAGQVSRVDPQQQILSRAELLALGPDGQLYVSVAGAGVVRIDPRTLAISAVPFTAQADSVDLRPFALTLQQGRLWYANHQGLLWLDPASGRFEFVPGVSRGADVREVAADRDGLWLARSDRLEHYRLHAGAATLDRQLGSEQGWTDQNLTGLLVDRRNRLWALTHTGLWRYDGGDNGDGQFHQLGMQDALFNSEFVGGGVRLRPDGPVYAATQTGVLGFYPERLREDGVPPQPAITELVRRGADSLVQLPPDSSEVALGWRDRGLQVTVRAFSFVNPAGMRYRMRMDGLDDHWVDVGNRGEREFNGLAPGDYVLQVHAAGSDGRWGALSWPLNVHVQAPPWRRWWAWVGYLLALLLAGWAGLLLWRRRLGQRHAMQLSEQSRELAEQASAAKTRFLATLSHEIRTPMTGVMGMAELLLATGLNPVQHGYAQTIQRSGGILLRLLNDALDLARIETGRMVLERAPFSPRALLEEVEQLERGPAQAKGLTLKTQLADDLPGWIDGDVFRIRQVLINLVNNALKFTERGGVTLGARRDGGELLFTVSDTGPGIPEAAQARLFQPFEQGAGPQRRAGSGLGLAICRELAGLMGGSIELVSRVAHGSSFRLRLPLKETAAPISTLPAGAALPTAAIPSPAPAPVPAVATGDGGWSILLVEDDGIVAAVIRGMLEAQGHRVTYVNNGLAALAELSRQRFGLLLLDLDLPGLDGFQLARIVRQRWPEPRLPIVAVSARSAGDELQRTREAGIDGFLRKPLTGEELAATMRRLVEGEALSPAG